MKQEIKTFLRYDWLVPDHKLDNYNVEAIDEYWLGLWDGDQDVIANAQPGDYWIEGDDAEAIVRIELGNAIEIWSRCDD